MTKETFIFEEIIGIKKGRNKSSVPKSIRLFQKKILCMRKNNETTINPKNLRDIIKKSVDSYLKKRKLQNNSGRINGSIPDISDFVSKICYDNFDFVKNQKYDLNEGLIHTYDVDKVKNIVCIKFNLVPDQFRIENRGGDESLVKLVFILLDKDVSKNVIGDIKHFMSTCGYFLAYPQEIYEEIIVLIFEPRFSENIFTEIKEKYNYLFHATPTIYVNKILKNGLIPKNKNTLFLYPDRTFCMKGDVLTNNDIGLLKNVQMQRGKTVKYDNNEYTILKIDISMLPENMKMYTDPMAKGAIFTYDNIPPSAISITGKL